MAFKIDRGGGTFFAPSVYFLFDTICRTSVLFILFIHLRWISAKFVKWMYSLTFSVFWTSCQNWVFFIFAPFIFFQSLSFVSFYIYLGVFIEKVANKCMCFYYLFPAVPPRYVPHYDLLDPLTGRSLRNPRTRSGLVRIRMKTCFCWSIGLFCAKPLVHNRQNCKLDQFLLSYTERWAEKAGFPQK